MPISAQTKTLNLIRELVSPDMVSAQEVVKRSGGLPVSLAEWARQLAAAQRNGKPVAHAKGLILFAADSSDSNDGSNRVKSFFHETQPFIRFAHQQQVKLAVTDIGLTEDFSGAPFSGRIFRQRQPLKAASSSQRFWESAQAGVRMACLLRGKGTEIFGVGSLREFPTAAKEEDAMIVSGQWEVAAMAGALLGAANLQTITVVGGASGHAALALAQSWSPLIKDYVISADAANDFLGVSSDAEAQSLLGVVLTLGLCTQATQGTEVP